MLVVNTLGKSLGVYQRDLKAKQPTTFLCCSCLTDIGRLLQQVNAVTVIGGTHTRVHAGTLGAHAHVIRKSWMRRRQESWRKRSASLFGTCSHHLDAALRNVYVQS